MHNQVRAGNIRANGKVALLFIDFATGDTLHLQGPAYFLPSFHLGNAVPSGSFCSQPHDNPGAAHA
jgi:hypothetical protein